MALRLKKDPQSRQVLLTKSQLGQGLSGLKQYAEAETQLREAYQGLVAQKDKLPPAARRAIPQTAEALAELYEAWGKKLQATEWRKKLSSPEKP